MTERETAKMVLTMLYNKDFLTQKDYETIKKWEKVLEKEEKN